MTGDKLSPNQIIESLGIRLHAGEQAASQGHIRGAYRLVGLLRTLSGAIANRLRREIFRGEVLFNQISTGADRVITQVGRVCSHVGDITRFIKSLRQHHGFFDAKAHSRTRGLLQGRRNKRCRRFGAGLTRLKVSDRKRSPLHGLYSRFSICLGLGLELCTAPMRHHESNRINITRLQQGVDFPIFLGDESADFPLALNNQSHRNRLNATGRQAPRHLGP